MTAGRHFIALKGDPTGDDFHAMWIDPTDSEPPDPGRRPGHAHHARTAATTWSSWYNQPTAQIYHVSTDNRFPYWVYGAQQDSGAVALPSRTESVDGITMQQFHEITAGGESGMIAPDPDDPNIIYGGTVDEARHSHRPDPRRRSDARLSCDPLSRRLDTAARVLQPRPEALYFANQRLFRTQDGGEHWAPISPDLTRPDAGFLRTSTPRPRPTMIMSTSAAA